MAFTIMTTRSMRGRFKLTIANPRDQDRQRNKISQTGKIRYIFAVLGAIDRLIFCVRSTVRMTFARAMLSKIRFGQEWQPWPPDDPGLQRCAVAAPVLGPMLPTNVAINGCG